MSVSRIHAKSYNEMDDARLSKAYCLVPIHDDIVDAVIKIMDEEGPRPMRNMKPSQKLYTGAERFQIEHHGEYEARGRYNYDKVSRVCVHNSAYPKLHDELGKKHSMAKPVAFIDNQKQYRSMRVDPIYQSLKLNGKVRNVHRYSIKGPKFTSAIHKPKGKSKSRRSNDSVSRSSWSSRMRINKGCQCIYPKPVEKCVSTYDSNDDDQDVDMQTARNCFERKFESKHESQRKANSKKSINTNSMISAKEEQEAKSEKRKSASQSRKSSVPSISSYNSYMSMDHEPMVQ